MPSAKTLFRRASRPPVPNPAPHQPSHTLAVCQDPCLPATTPQSSGKAAPSSLYPNGITSFSLGLTRA